MNMTMNTLNGIGTLMTYQRSANDIWKLGDNEAPPEYTEAAFDEFDQALPFNSHFYAGTPVAEFPKELNDDNFQQVYIHFNLTEKEAASDQLLFLDTLYSTHDNVPYFDLMIRIGKSMNDLGDLGKYRFSSDGSYPEERYILVPEKYLEPGENLILFENANPAGSGHWIVWDSLRFGDLKKAYYQWYDMNGRVGSGEKDHLVPSIDNAWLAASLITIREYARENGESDMVGLSDALLKGIDLTMWYNYTDHRFFLGDINDPQKGTIADHYSNENRIINFLARAMGQINKTEFRSSIDALERSDGTYGNITVPAVNWDGSYFTYTSSALFIMEKDTAYLKTIENATKAQIIYANDRVYPCWGISDAVSPDDPDVYLDLGAPPAAGKYNDRGVLAPYVSAMALINNNTELQDKAIANVGCLKNISELYDTRYGFRDSINVSSNRTSRKFLTLDQEWIFLSLADYKNGTIWRYFYNDIGVKTAHEEMFGSVIADCGPDKLRCENVGAPVQFNGSASNDPDGAVISYYWEFGDGTNGTGVAPVHKYSTYRWNGTAYQPFIVNLKVTDNDGLANSTSQKIVIWIAGDANGDGKVNILDASVVGLNWAKINECADLNNDGKVNILDASIIGLNWGKNA
jgi:hypothetical protein